MEQLPAHTRLGQEVFVDWILSQFSDKRTEAQKEYRRFVLAGIDEPCPWTNLKAQCLLGGKKFIEKIAPALKDKSRLTEIPKKQRLVHRLALEHVLSDETRTSKGERLKK